MSDESTRDDQQNIMDTELSNQEEIIKRLELQVRIEKMKNQMIADDSKCGLWEYDIESKVYTQSRKLDGKWSNKNLKIENYREKMKSWGLIHPDDIGIFDAYCDSMDHGETEFTYELRATSDHGLFIWLRYIGNAVYDDNGKATKIVGKTLDITKQKAEIAALTKIASQDPLTHLYHKSATQEQVEVLLKKDQKDKNSGIQVLYLMDIDNFKEINDRWGHLYGDSVLEKFAAFLQAYFSGSNVVGRIGGDEFLVYCSNIEDVVQAEQLAYGFKLRVTDIDLKDGEFVTASIGMALYPDHGKTYETLYKNADIALHQAKLSGKNKYRLFQRNMLKVTKIGETDLKKETNQITNRVPKEMTHIEKDLFDYSFETICLSNNFSEALQLILSEIGIRFRLDTILVMEYNLKLKKVSIMQRWKKDKEKISETDIIAGYTNQWNRVEECFYHQKRRIIDSSMEEFIDDKLLNKFGILAAVQYPIFDGSHLVGLISFEVQKEKRIWNATQIATLSSITKMISSYILRMRLKSELDEETLYTDSAMDIQKLTYYSIDKETYELMYVSRYANELFPNIKIGEKCYESVKGIHQPCDDCPLKGLNHGKKRNAIEIYDEDSDTWFTVSASIIDKYCTKHQYLICWMDITVFLDRVKSTDQLTSTLSYDKFRAESLKRLSTNPRKHSYATAFIGIRNFADVNEHYGYTVGDYVLQLLAKQFMESLQREELICRIKGDDFILLLKSDDIHEAKERIARICKVFHSRVREKFPYMALRCDCGVYKIKQTDYSISGILDKANLAKKQAMSLSYEWDSIVILTEEAERLENEEKRMERLMLEALRKEEYCVYLQPKVNVSDGSIIGAEALVRWITRENQLVSPAKFIPVAEKCGIVTEIDKYVYEVLFRQLHQWLQEGYKIPLISFNVSRIHLFDDGFVDYLKDLVEKYNIPYSLLEIEITESVFFDNVDRMIDMIIHLRSLGFTISMDDFGTGYSTLSLMKSLPMDVLKIDGNFFYRNHLDHNSKAIISAIIQLAKNLGIKVVAEGIETLEQVIYIQEEACDYAQGFYYYKPLPMNDFQNVIEKD